MHVFRVRLMLKSVSLLASKVEGDINLIIESTNKDTAYVRAAHIVSTMNMATVLDRDGNAVRLTEWELVGVNYADNLAEQKNN